MVSDRTELSTEIQYIKATTKALDSTVTLGLNVPYIDIDLGGGRGVTEPWSGEVALHLGN